MSDPTPPLLSMQGIDKAFPGVKALVGAHLEVRAGEILALMGENGAGKSTLVKVLAGAHRPDAGRIEIDGRPVSPADPQQARREGIAVIYQEFSLVPELSARENIFLGHEKTRLGFFSASDERTATAALLARLGAAIDPDIPVRLLSVAQQQVVEIARALAFDVRIIVMDEPTAALTAQETEKLFEVMRELRAQGIGIVYISHRLEEIFRIADKVTVMRDGRTVGSVAVPELTRRTLIEMMVGRKLETEFPHIAATLGEVRLEVTGLRRLPAVRDVSFQVHRGEIVGLTGLVGAGRTEVARAIFGADRLDAGTIAIDGRQVRIRSPRDAIRHRICFLTEDRKNQGLILGQTVLHNFGLPNLGHFARAGFVDERRERRAFSGFVEDLRIKISSPDQHVENLSGGNQQKIVLARWLESNADIILFDEPTRGIDVGAKYEIYLLMNRLAEAGKAILMISSELPEILGMSDRILVMREGRITGEIQDVAGATQEDIMNLAIGGTPVGTP